jgi:hypothetical protein
LPKPPEGVLNDEAPAQQTGGDLSPLEMDEPTWTQRILRPLLGSLGFIKVDYVHGVDEHGRDVVFAEYDRFGLLRFYCAQVKVDAKLGTSRATGGLSGLLDQLRSAYAMPYMDPANGVRHRMSGVYLITRGSITSTAKQRLQEETGQWLHIVDGQQIDLAARFFSRFVTDDDRALRLVVAAKEVVRCRLMLQDQVVHVLRAKVQGAPDYSSTLPPTEEPVARNAAIPFRPLPHAGLDRVLHFAALEINDDDLTILLEVQEFIACFNFMISKIPFGAIRDDAGIEASCATLRSFVSLLRHLVDPAVEILLHVHTTERPAQGQLAERCPTVNHERVMEELNRMKTDFQTRSPVMKSLWDVIW